MGKQSSRKSWNFFYYELPVIICELVWDGVNVEQHCHQAAHHIKPVHAWLSYFFFHFQIIWAIWLGDHNFLHQQSPFSIGWMRRWNIINSRHICRWLCQDVPHLSPWHEDQRTLVAPIAGTWPVYKGPWHSSVRNQLAEDDRCHAEFGGLAGDCGLARVGWHDWVLPAVK